MEPEQTGRHYDELADIWQQPHLQTNGIAQVERAIRFTKNRGPALDIGCGSSGRFIELLLKEGFEPEGIDVSSRMLALARARHPAVSFQQADIAKWDFPKKYDIILGWDCLWHLPLERQEPVLSKICEGLNSKGVFIFSTGGIDGPGEKSDSFMGPRMDYSALGIPKTLELLTKFGCVCRHLEYDQYPEEHLFLIAQKG
jgi:SAM-dependent methyltransferase